MKPKKFIFLASCLLLLITSFTIYSYSQVDLNLTLSSNSAYQSVQHQLTQLGQFNRPLSTTIFTTILGLFITYYLLLVAFHHRWKLSTKQLWILLLIACSLLLFSYPAFSHDIFNYIFDTRILLKHHQNPWVAIPLDFPNDQWTRFMRWTHNPAAYPPGWIITTIPFYLLGFGKFTLTLFSYKILNLISFLAASWLMLKLAGRRSWVLWSFNPMILITSLSSGHNDVTMTAFTLLGFYLFKQKGSSSLKRRILSKIALVWGGLIKYLAFLVLPFLKSPTKAAIISWAGAGVVTLVRDINPWYFLLPITLSIMSKNPTLTKIAVTVSLLLMYRFYPCVAVFSC